MHYVRCCCAKFETISRVCLLVSPSKYVFNVLCTPFAVCQLKSLVVQAIFINFHVECLSNLVSHYTITLKSNENTLTYFQSLMWKSSLYLSIRHTNGSFPRNPFARFFFLFQLLFCTCINWLDDRNVFFFLESFFFKAEKWEWKNGFGWIKMDWELFYRFIEAINLHKIATQTRNTQFFYSERQRCWHETSVSAI